MIPLLTTWGHSSAGRAPAWHAGGRRFDPAWLHQHPVIRPIGWMQHQNSSFRASPSSRGLGHHPFTVATGVRIPVGTPVTKTKSPDFGRGFLFASQLLRACRKHLANSSHPRRIRPPASWGHSSAGRAPAWHAGGRRFDPAWLHQHPVIRPIGWMQHQNSSFRASPSSRGLGHHPFTVATGVRIPVGTPLIRLQGPGFPFRQINAMMVGSRYQRGAIAQLGERLHGMQEVGGSIPPGSTNIRSLGRSDGCSIKIQVFVRPHRLEA